MRNDPLPSIPPSDRDAHAKPLPRRLPLASTPPDLVPARMINEALYCERLLYLEWAQGEFADNAFTVEGRVVHKRADEPGGKLPPTPIEAPPQESSNEPEVEPPPYQARTVWLSSERLGITAKIDVVEGDADGRVLPIEYKRGQAPDLPEGAWLPERAQLCAQVLLLREHGYQCDRAAIYFAGSRRRVEIVIDDALIARTLEAVARAREVTTRVEPPAPLVDSPKCNGCSLVGICLPDETNLLHRIEQTRAPEPAAAVELDEVPFGSVEDADEESGPRPLRRLHPACDDQLPLYVQDQGARITLDGDCLVVKGRKTPSIEARLPNTSHLALYGNVQITAQALRALLERNIPVSFFSYGGWYYGRASGFDSKNIELRVAQHRAADDSEFCLRVARGLVASKVRNCRTMLRRNHAAPPPVVLSELEQLARKAEQAEALESLLGIEGTAARSYFGAFTGMLKGEAALSGTFDLDGRNRRPPKDPINALLSFVYSLLTKDFALAISAAGLDPLRGFYHQPRFGRPALALDLMEEFRPLVADSVVIGALNGGTFDGDDFLMHPSGVAMRPAARKRLLMAYERRMDQRSPTPSSDTGSAIAGSSKSRRVCSVGVCSERSRSTRRSARGRGRRCARHIS